MICQAVYVGGYGRGQPCRFRASTVIASRDWLELVCGYHARQYTPDVQYPLDWNLARIRAWRLDNLEALSART